MRKYWCMIPPSVYHDGELSDSSKLLFGKIMGLVNATGYCWAGNAFLAEEMGKSERSIQRAINELEKREYLVIDLSKGQRKIRVNLVGDDKMDAEWGRKISDSVKTNGSEGDKNVTHDKTVVTPTTKLSPDGVTDVTRKDETKRNQSKTKHDLLTEMQTDEIFKHWDEKRRALFLNRGARVVDARLTSKRKKKVQTRLIADKFTVGDIKSAIDGCFGSDWHTERGLVDLAWILDNRERVESFILKSLPQTTGKVVEEWTEDPA